jgi:hypothetical protein
MQAWTSEDAELLIVNAPVLDSDTKALETVRKKVTQLLKIGAVKGIEPSS